MRNETRFSLQSDNGLDQKVCASTASFSPISRNRIKNAKSAFSTRRVDLRKAAFLMQGDVTPQPGDLVLAEVKSLHQHQRLELACGRRARLFPGDEIILAFGNRYAPNQFEAEVPASLGDCHMAAAGGIAAEVLSRNAGIKKATRIKTLGILANGDGQGMNLRDWALDTPTVQNCVPGGIIAVAGTSMDAGKTTTAACMIHGLTRAGLRVAAAKITGTGSGCDVWHMTDAGATRVVDFTDAGHASTYKLPLPDMLAIAEKLIGALAADKPDVIILEIADGLYQKDTSTLLQSKAFLGMIDGMVFAAREAMSAASGVQWLRQHGHNVLAVSGAISAAPLSVREAEAVLDVPLLDRETMCDGEQIPTILMARTLAHVA
jgi:hypothetical protein